MAQHDMVIDNSPGLAVRLDMNAAIQALVSQSSGPVEPLVKFPGMVWLDTSWTPDGLLRQRNLSNTAWINMTVSPTTPGQEINQAFEKTVPLDTDEIPMADTAIGQNFRLVKITIANLRASIIPIGAGMEYFGTVAPVGWIFPYGQAVSRTIFSRLFAVFQTRYGAGDGSTTFNLPDKRGRVSAGLDNMGGTSANRLTGLAGGVNGDTLGAVGGVEAVALTLAQMAAHNHSGITGYVSADHQHLVQGNTSTDPGHAHGPAAGTGFWNTNNTGGGFDGGSIRYATSGTTAAAGAHHHSYAVWTGGINQNHYHSIPAEGGGAVHNNLPPTIVCNYIIYAGV